MYNTIRDDKDGDHSGVSVSSHPSPLPISNVTPLRKENNKRFGIKEDKYPSPGAYFPMKNNSMGTHKRPIFLSASNRRLHDPPTVDTSRPERNTPSRMTKMEGWPSSPRRMQMVSPRFKSLSDLMEGPEGSEQQSSEDSDMNVNPFRMHRPITSSGRRSFSNTKKLFVYENIGDDSVSETSDQDSTKGHNEKRLSFTSNLGEIIQPLSSLRSQQKPPELNKSSYVRKTRTLGLDLFSTKDKSSVDEQKTDTVRRSIASRLFPSIQSRRTTPQMLTVRTPLPMLSETEDDEEEDHDLTDSTNDHNPQLPSSDNSDISPVPATPITTPLTPTTVKSMVHSWRWPKRPFSPAREKKEIEQIKSADNPADHIGKVGNNIWAKKTLGQLRKYHQRHSPSMLTKGFGLASPLKESSPLLSPVKVDLTDSGADDKSPRSPTIIAPKMIEESEEPQGMKVSPEHLTVVGGPSVNNNRESPNASTTSLTLRSNPSISSLAKHNAKPLYETTFTISNITEAPLRFEILWPAFRFDVSPAYGIVKPQSVEVVKVSVMNKHILAGSRRDETRDSRKFMGILNNKGSEKTEVDKPLMGRTRIIVLCENGERKEVIVDIVQIKKKTKGEIENLRSKNTKEVEDGNFIRRIGKSSGRSFSRTVDDLIKAAKARTRKSTPKQERLPRSPSNSNLKGKSSINKATGSSSKPASAPALRRSASSGPTSRPSSPESSNKHYNSPKRKHTTASSSSSSRPNTPDIYRSQNERNKRNMSPSSVSRSRTPDESKQVKHLPQRKNFIYIGTPGSVNCPDTTVREENHSVFRIHNPTNKPVTWHLTTATNPFLRRSDSANSSQKINEEVFLIMKTSGLLRAGTTEKVVISFRPTFVGTYSQSFNLEDSSSSETSGGLGGVSVRIQGEGKIDSPNQNKSSDSRRHGSGSNKAIDFEVSETKIQIPATRISRRRSVGIKINNPTNQLIRIKCKCEVGGTSSNSNSAISIPLSSVQIKPRAFVLLPVRFSPKEIGEVRGIVKLQAVGRSEVQVEINAEGVMDASSSTTEI
ncbi:6232_t:CDS:2 [Diversispora eburnea]|uniref:6232_t:CDS:1 n=1 Tax=Diversispora eburnea TaxID=1213867 RepID=A0A9N9A3F1_9GLOM|nr:6232_t:CDS:2 [Diversispora eburnea]